MTHASRKRTNILALLTILTLSSATMVWLFWHFPVITMAVTVAVLAGLGISARLARAVDGADLSELRGGNHSV